jgi:hypothetical protein
MDLFVIVRISPPAAFPEFSSIEMAVTGSWVSLPISTQGSPEEITQSLSMLDLSHLFFVDCEG